MQELNKSKSKNSKPFCDSLIYSDYKLKEGDKLFIQVYSTDSKLNTLFNGSGTSGMQSSSSSGPSSDLYTYQIKPDGSIQFPVIGEVKLEGKTLRESKKTLQEAIKQVISPNSVDVRLIGKSFYIVGGGKSGRFTFPKEKVNIFQAMAMAGDIGLYTDRSKIRILRQTPNGSEIKTFDVRDIGIINSEFYYLEPDDMLFLQPMRSQFFGVTTLWGGISTVITTISFATGIYGILTKE